MTTPEGWKVFATPESPFDGPESDLILQRLVRRLTYLYGPFKMPTTRQRWRRLRIGDPLT